MKDFNSMYLKNKVKYLSWNLKYLSLNFQVNIISHI